MTRTRTITVLNHCRHRPPLDNGTPSTPEDVSFRRRRLWVRVVTPTPTPYSRDWRKSRVVDQRTVTEGNRFGLSFDSRSSVPSFRCLQSKDTETRPVPSYLSLRSWKNRGGGLQCKNIRVRRDQGLLGCSGKRWTRVLSKVESLTRPGPDLFRVPPRLVFLF